MCPTKLKNVVTLEASSNPDDWGVCSKFCNLKHYKSNEEIYDQIVELSERYFSIARPFILGNSLGGQPLIGLRISKDVRQERQLLKPMVRLVANIHGNEATGREILLNLGQHLLMAYGIDKRITKMIDTTDISILPSVNPDGFDKAQEGECSGTGQVSGSTNGNGVDLNNDFPTWAEFQRFTTDFSFDPFSGGRQPETLSMMNWSTQPFVISANLRDGAVLVTYPFDHFKFSEKGRENITPENDLFIHLATTYTSQHKTMINGTNCYRRSYDRGMENGALWNSKNSKGEISGSLKDFSYLFTNNLDITLYTSCCKFPKSFFLVQEWENNKESLLSYLEQVHMGIKGIVSLDGRVHGGAEVITWNTDGSQRDKRVLTSEFGEYWRLVLPGPNGNNTYSVQARFEDCQPGGSGRIYESLKHKVIVSFNNPLKQQDLRMRVIGYCGADEITNLQDRQNVINDLERFAAEDRLSQTNNLAEDIFNQNFNIEDAS